MPSLSAVSRASRAFNALFGLFILGVAFAHEAGGYCVIFFLPLTGRLVALLLTRCQNLGPRSGPLAVARPSRSRGCRRSASSRACAPSSRSECIKLSVRAERGLDRERPPARFSISTTTAAFSSTDCARTVALDGPRGDLPRCPRRDGSGFYRSDD